MVRIDCLGFVRAIFRSRVTPTLRSAAILRKRGVRGAMQHARALLVCSSVSGHGHSKRHSYLPAPWALTRLRRSGWYSWAETEGYQNVHQPIVIKQYFETPLSRPHTFPHTGESGYRWTVRRPLRRRPRVEASVCAARCAPGWRPSLMTRAGAIAASAS